MTTMVKKIHTLAMIGNPIIFNKRPVNHDA